MKTAEELWNEIFDILTKSQLYKDKGYISMYDLGLKEDEYPVLLSYGDIEFKISQISRYKVYVSVYKKRCSETYTQISYKDLAYKDLKFIYPLVKKQLK